MRRPSGTGSHPAIPQPRVRTLVGWLRWALALTALDLVLRPELVQAAKDYFQNVQLKQRKYTPCIRPTDQPATWMNKGTMDRYRPEMRKYYFDQTKYKTYMDQMAAQFGIKYPTIKDGATQ